MADTRCANPEYSLDVDEMILEYLLYNTTKAHLHDFRACETSPRQNTGTYSAARLLEVFDQFLDVFKLNHPRSEFEPDIEFSIKLLQFVVLFTQRRSPTTISPSSRKQLKWSSKQTSAIRMGWWQWRRDTAKQSSEEDTIIDRWRGFFNLAISPDGGCHGTLLDGFRADAAQHIPLLELLPRFLDLSADIAANLKQEVTKQWMDLAAEFMLQSAWEKHVYLNGEAGEEPLKEAFGWGRWDMEAGPENALINVSATAEATTAEVRIDGMFSASDESSGDAAGREIPDWTTIRLAYLSAFGTNPGGRESGKQMRRWQIERLKEIAERLPMKLFDRKVVDYLEGLWKLGTEPLLVQVEQGEIEGMTKEECVEFMENVFPKGSGPQKAGQGGQWWN